MRWPGINCQDGLFPRPQLTLGGHMAHHVDVDDDDNAEDGAPDNDNNVVMALVWIMRMVTLPPLQGNICIGALYVVQG